MEVTTIHLFQKPPECVGGKHSSCGHQLLGQPEWGGLAQNKYVPAPEKMSLYSAVVVVVSGWPGGSNGLQACQFDLNCGPLVIRIYRWVCQMETTKVDDIMKNSCTTGSYSW